MASKRPTIYFGFDYNIGLSFDKENWIPFSQQVLPQIKAEYPNVFFYLDSVRTCYWFQLALDSLGSRKPNHVLPNGVKITLIAIELDRFEKFCKGVREQGYSWCSHSGWFQGDAPTVPDTNIRGETNGLTKLIT